MYHIASGNLKEIYKGTEPISDYNPITNWRIYVMLDDVNKGDMHFFTLTCNLKTGQNSEPAEADYSIGKTPINKPFPGGDPRETHLTWYSTIINGESIPTSSYPPDSTWQSAAYDLAAECFGFARYVYFYIFGYKESESVKSDYAIKTPPRTLVSADDARQYFFGTGGGNTITKVKNGSHIRINRNSGIPHSMIVCEFNADYIIVYHANWPNKNIVKITYFTWQEFVDEFNTISYVTVDIGKFKKHNFTGVYIMDKNGHQRKCVDIGCNKISDLTDHTIRMKTTASQHYSECSVCLYTWDYISHSFTYVDTGTQHTKKCKTVTCGYSVMEAHTLPANYNSYSSVYHAKLCKLCSGWTGLTNHTISSTWSNDTTTHYKTCTGCSYRANTANHTLIYTVSGTQHIKKCNTCSYSVLEAHTLLTSNSSHSATQHGKKCTLCSTWTGLTNHSLYDWVTTNSSIHYKICSVCSYQANAANHSWSAYTNYSSTQHKRTCSTCQRTEYANHSLSGWVGDTSNHWKTCASCNVKINAAAHVTGSWIKDSTQHYRTCTTCGKQLNLGNHSLSSGAWTKVATSSTCRKRTMTCGTCAYSTTEYDYAHFYVLTSKTCSDCGYKKP